MSHRHKLLLIDHNAVGILRCLIATEVVDRSHIASTVTDIVICCSDVECRRAEESIYGNQILDAVGLHILNKASDTRRGELKDILRIALGEYPICLLIIEHVARYLLYGQLLIVMLIYEVYGGTEFCQLLCCQHILFKQSNLIDRVSIKLRYQRSVHLAYG